MSAPINQAAFDAATPDFVAAYADSATCQAISGSMKGDDGDYKVRSRKKRRLGKKLEAFFTVCGGGGAYSSRVERFV